MEETRVLALSGELALAGRARAALLHLLRRREESEACGGGGEMGARARICLISGDNFPSSRASLSSRCIAAVYSSINIYFSFIKKHFME